MNYDLIFFKRSSLSLVYCHMSLYWHFLPLIKMKNVIRKNVPSKLFPFYYQTVKSFVDMANIVIYKFKAKIL